MSRWAWLFSCTLLGACAPVPRPTIFAQVERTRTAAATEEAAQRAPQAYLEAEKIHRAADEALSDGDRAGSEILAERALGAYARAQALTRLANAEERRKNATRELAKAQSGLASVDVELQKATAAAADLEARVRVERDAVPVAPSEPASGDREKARLTAARALAAEARLLCVAATLLGADSKTVAAPLASLDTLDAELAKSPARPPIDTAVRLRAECLRELTAARRTATSAAPEADGADALLAELSQASFEPSRDDRGVVVVLRDVFQGSSLAKATAERVTALGQVGRSHPEFPVLVVVHTAKGKATARDAERGALVADALRAAGTPRAETRAAGDALPVSPGGTNSAAARNERVEIVFVARTL